MWQFSRTVAPETSKGAALISVMRYYEWQKTVFLTSYDSVWFQSTLQLVQQLQAAGLEVQQLPAFEPSAFKPTMLTELRHMGIRIVTLLGGSSDRAMVAAAANKYGLSDGWAWLTTYRLNRKKEHKAKKSLIGWLFFGATITISNATNGFVERVRQYNKLIFKIDAEVSLHDEGLLPLYDAIMLFAHAATKVLGEGGSLLDGQAVSKAVRDAKLDGMAGLLDVDEQGNRIESYELMNYVMGTAPKMRSEPFGMYNSTLQQYTAYEKVVVWPGRTTEVPIDYSSGAS